MHKEQQDFCLYVKKLYPDHFENKIVLDIGSLDINGNNRFLFRDCTYIGIDVGEGKNVDIVMPGHKYDDRDESIDLVISTECFEHDMYWDKTIANSIRLLKPGGMLLFSCAAPGRAEHGTRRTSPHNSPLTQVDEDWADYYKNLGEKDIREKFDLDEIFSKYEIKEVHDIRIPWSYNINDLYFYGIKK